MSSQLQREREQHKTDDYDVEHVDIKPQDTAKALSGETDDLLEDIDGLLEENAQEFVDSYLQVGGE